MLILSPDACLGAPLSEALGGGDTVLDLEITPNRPDLLSHIGIAREIAAVTGNSLRLPQISFAEDSESAEKLASVAVEAADLCPRYTARVIRGVKIGPSPDWLRQKLESIGARPINNVVDITNFVLYEIGQPLHAFDLALLADKKIVVRRARAGEKIAAIDGNEYKPDTETLLIADAAKPVAIAGIMGSQGSEINDRTTDILLESAYFQPAAIRRASKKLALRSESSYRFERGCDIGICNWASRRTAVLIAEITGGKICRGLIDTNPIPHPPSPIPCRYSRINSRLGIEVPRETTKKIFTGLGLSIANETADACEVQPPTFRVDLANEADLAEEVCRLYGVDKIPAVAAPAHAAWSDADARYDAIANLRSLLTSLGFWESISPTLISETSALRHVSADTKLVKLKNPLSEEMAVLRPSLLHGLFTSLRVNVTRGNADVRLFEIGCVFCLKDGQPTETLHLSLAITGRRNLSFSEGTDRDAKVDSFDLFGAVQVLAEQVFHTDSNKLLPYMGGLLKPQALRQYDLRDPVFFAELDLDVLLAVSKPASRFTELPKFPSVARDIAMVVNEETTHAQIVSAIQSKKPDWLENVEIFDIFRGEAIGTGKKSVAYRLTYRAADRTLTDAEVNRVHDKVKAVLQKALSCEIRE